MCMRRGQRSTSDILHNAEDLLFKKGSLTDLETTDLAGLVSQHALGIRLSPRAGIRSVYHNTWLFMWVLGQHSGLLACVTRALPIEPSSKPQQ